MSSKGCSKRVASTSWNGTYRGNGLVLLDAADRVAWASEEVQGAVGLAPDKLEGMPAARMLAALGLGAEALIQVERGLSSGDAFRVHIAPNTELHGTPRPAPGGLATGRVIWFGPANGRVAHEPELYRTAMEGISDAVWELDLLAMSSHWGSGLRRLLRVPEDEQEVGVEAWLQRVPQETATRLIDLGQQYREGTIDRHMEEYPLRCFDGVVRWMLDRGSVLERNAEGRPVKVVGVVTDIDRVKRAEERLARTEHRLAEVFKAFGAAVMLEDEQHRILLVNDAFCAFTGFARHELEGAFAYDILADPRAIGQFNAPELFVEQVGALVMNRVPVLGQRLDMKDDRVFEFDYTPIVSEVDGSGHLWVCRDVSERHRLQAALGSSQRLLSAVVDRIGVGVVLDEDKRIRLANDTLCRIFGAGVDAASLVGLDCDEAIAGAAQLFREPEAFLERTREQKAGWDAVDGELLELVDGRILERGFMPLELPGGRRGNLFTYRDVTERQRMVEDLRISGELLTTVIGSIDAALFLEDGQRRVRLANAAFCSMFGIDVEPERLQGMDCAQAAQAAAALMCDPQGFLEGIAATLSRGAAIKGEELHLMDGRVLERSHTRVRLNAEEEGHLWVYRDVTERHRLEREKREMGERNERLLAAVAQATAGLVRGGPVLEAMRHGLTAVGLATGVDRVYLFQNKQDIHGRVRSTSQRFEWNSGGAEPQIDNPDLMDTPVEVFAEIVPIMEKGLSWAAHVHDLDPGGVREVLEPQGILSILILPIMEEGRFWGFMGFDQCTQLREWTSNERSILRSLCASVTSALERERLLEQRAQDLAAEQAANRFNQRIMGLADEQAVCAAMVEEMGSAPDMEQVCVHVVDPVAGILRCVATNAADDPVQAPWESRVLDSAVAAEVVRQRAIRWIYDLRDEQELRGTLLVPVICDGEVAVVISCHMRNLRQDVRERSRLPHKMADLAAMKLLQLRSFRAAREKDARYRRVIANMQLGLVEVDPSQRITYVNDSLCAMSGYRSEELLGRKLFEVEGLRAPMETFASKRELRSKGIADAFEVGVTLRSGDERHWFISGAPQFDAEGRHIGSVSVVLDITDRRRMERELVAANRKAGEALQAKELFLANMSHEMRTPMNAIVGLCNEMLRESTDPVHQARLSAVIMAGNNLMKLMNDLLDASRTAVGMLKLDHVPMDVGGCLRQVELVMRPLALQKGLALHGTVSGSVAPLFMGDPRRLDQVLMNLVGNALKFTQRGRVDLALDMVAPTADGQRLRFTVRDTGVGIDPSFMPLLFEPFSRDPGQQDLAVEGAGLGLSITKGLVDLMGGTITAESEPGKGTTMVLELEIPFAQPVHEPAPVAMDRPAALLPQGLRILLVEDSAFNRMVVRSMLGGQAVVLHEAEHGADAMAHLCAQDHDIILLDLRMPVMDGYAFMEGLRGTLRSTVPVVALTAGDDGDAELLAAGLDAVLRKPFDRNALLNVLGEHVRALDAPGCWQHHRVPGGPRLDTSNVLDLVDGDEALMGELVAAFLKDTPENIARLRTAMLQGDMVRIAEVAHRLRPSVRMLGMEGVQDVVDELVALSRTPRPLSRVATMVVLLVRELRHVAHILRQGNAEQ
jgi:PAS domain S-box-containing protein